MVAKTFLLKKLYRNPVTIDIISKWVDNRIEQKKDAIVIFSGARGNGKSTGAIKLAKKFKHKFRMRTDILFSREDVINAFKKKEKGVIIADEMIMVGYRREFHNRIQQEFIKLLNTQRDKGNIFIACVPNFANLDKDILSLTFLHIHIAKRGTGYLFCPPESSIFSTDRWKLDECKKLEERFRAKNIAKGVPAWKLPNFVGTMCFTKLTDGQEERYQGIKDEKRTQFFEETSESGELPFNVCRDCKTKARYIRSKEIYRCNSCPNTWNAPERKIDVTTPEVLEVIPLDYSRASRKKDKIEVTIE